mmetsp:Transcript_22004/g.62533  ORF Transcript_22004/g.62533 Transcript_22004/m.62533 type:complete len:304 (-) Transcript_22004:164-1075(-)
MRWLTRSSRPIANSTSATSSMCVVRQVRLPLCHYSRSSKSREQIEKSPCRAGPSGHCKPSSACCPRLGAQRGLRRSRSRVRTRCKKRLASHTHGQSGRLLTLSATVAVVLWHGTLACLCHGHALSITLVRLARAPGRRSHPAPKTVLAHDLATEVAVRPVAAPERELVAWIVHTGGRHPRGIQHGAENCSVVESLASLGPRRAVDRRGPPKDVRRVGGQQHKRLERGPQLERLTELKVRVVHFLAAGKERPRLVGPKRVHRRLEGRCVGVNIVVDSFEAIRHLRGDRHTGRDRVHGLEPILGV